MAYSKEEIEETFGRIIKHIEDGNSLRSALREDNTPSSKDFYEWIDSNESFAKQYTCACARRADSIFEDILNIADESEGDKVSITVDGIVSEKVDHENIQRAKLRVDARKWMLGKMNPKKYSDKSSLDLTTNGESINIISLGNGTDPNETPT